MTLLYIELSQHKQGLDGRTCHLPAIVQCVVLQQWCFQTSTERLSVSKPPPSCYESLLSVFGKQTSHGHAEVSRDDKQRRRRTHRQKEHGVHPEGRVAGVERQPEGQKQQQKINFSNISFT